MGQESRSSLRIQWCWAKRLSSFFLDFLSFPASSLPSSWLTRLAHGRTSSEAGDGETNQKYAESGDGWTLSHASHPFFDCITYSSVLRVRATASIVYFCSFGPFLSLGCFCLASCALSLNRKKGKKRKPVKV